MTPNDQDDERFESIPWSSLLPDEASRRSTWINIGGGVLIGLAVVAIGWRLFAGSTPSTSPEFAASTVAAPVPTGSVAPAIQSEPGQVGSAVADSASTTLPDASAATAASTHAEDSASSVGLTEADLMAAVPTDDVMAAVMRAEWFVSDYFTVDGDAASLAAVLEALPLMPFGPAHAHQQDSTGVSYVEWARATAAEPVGPGVFEIDVAFRTLAGDGGNVSRQPVRAVTVSVAVVDGATAVLDLPHPAPVPAGYPQPDLVIAPLTNAPETVTTEALAAVESAGFVGEVSAVAQVDGRWRVTLMAVDPSGLMFPLRFWG
ncbi:MAG: hypothetical protein ACR2NL_01715 [Acidimicrobiia bacterium]